MRSRLVVLPVLVASVAALVGVVAARPLVAQTSNAERQKQLKDQILHAGAAEAEALAALQAIRDRKAPIDARVAELDGELRNVAARLEPLEAAVAELATALADAEAKLAARQAEYQAAKAEADDQAAKIYRSARRGATYDYMSAARPSDLVNGSKYLDDVNHRQRAVVRRVTELRDSMDAQRKSIAEKKASAEAAAGEVQRLRDELARLRAELEPARVEAAAAAAAEEREIASIRSRKAEFEREYAELQAISDSIAAQLRLNPSGSGVAGACEFRPTPGPVVSGFGPRTNPIGGGTGMHQGIDISASSGTPIRACRGGKVVIAGWQGGYGLTVVIDHGGGMATLYAHQSNVAVSVGATVGPGEVIGYVGSTGQSTGPHLHFEVRIAGNPVNPMSYL